ncbi:precorrin-6A reductase [Fusobacterium sp. MFO224]|uniref:precorrin-6A reductase n=1 Tax=Fusobacterium sp. MFO224 TaxID=3378070 RepID=UPI003852296A
MDWVIGGTKDSRNFIENILELKENIIVTTISEYGKKLLEKYEVNVIVKSMEKVEMLKFIEKNKIKRIFDFTHPYAVNVSKNAMEISGIKGIEYFRFNRKTYNYKECIKFNKIEELTEFISDINENILNTLGSNSIEKFKNLKNLKNIYFRVLPTKISIEKVEKIGVLAKNILGIQGPFTKEFNSSIYKNYNIKYLITKESGDIGGEKEKIEAALENKVKVIVLKKPFIDYLWETDSMEIILGKFKEGMGD